MKQKRDKIKQDYSKKKVVLERYIHSAPFTRTTDKITFIYGVLQCIMISFILGRYPHTWFIRFYTFTICAKIFVKWMVYKSKGWHYYMTDFCYAANTIVVLWINFFPQNDIIFKMSFLYSNGPLAIAVGAMRNQMVFHSIDNMSSLAIHFLPQLITWSVRWNTMPYENTLPKEERMFLNITEVENFDYMTFFVYPVGFYIFWAILYFIINFYISAKRI